MVDMYRFDWLAKRQEEPIDKQRRIVDPHHHLWRRDGQNFLVDDLLTTTGAGHNVTHTVFVECHAEFRTDGPEHMRPVGETEFVAAQAAEAKAAGGSEIAAIVSHADMMLGAAAEEVLAAHEAAGDGLFRGIRHATSWVDDPGVRAGHSRPTQFQMAEPAFRDGVSTLGSMGFSFDAWLLHPQIPELTAMARDLPEVSIVLDHLGGPVGTGSFSDRRAQIFDEWKVSMAELATCPNVTLKVGGIGMEMYFGMGWHEQPEPPSSEVVASYWGDWIRYAIDTFGPDRCMFESNFPVDRSALPYTVLWNAFQIVAQQYSNNEQEQLFSGTATRVYKLEPA